MQRNTKGCAVATFLRFKSKPGSDMIFMNILQHGTSLTRVANRRNMACPSTILARYVS
jgi:hypothetical protein